MNNNKINIIKYIEEKENKDIFQDYYSILIILDGQKYSRKPLYRFMPMHKAYNEEVYNKTITNKSQIANRIQYIKQSGYKFKEYIVNDDTLTIVFE